jgi:hypothetical protein
MASSGFEANGAPLRFYKENSEDSDRRLGPGEKKEREARERNPVKKKKNRKQHDFSASSFDSFLEERGIRDEVEAVVATELAFNRHC